MSELAKSTSLGILMNSLPMINFVGAQEENPTLKNRGDVENFARFGIISGGVVYIAAMWAPRRLPQW